MAKSLFVKEMSRSYSVKYLGISNGQVGILSKRLPIPRISRLDSCRNKALSIIYAAADQSRRPPPKRIRSWIPRIQTLEDSIKDSSEAASPPPYRQPEAIEPSEVSKSESEVILIDPQKYDVFLVNQYSRPRSLKTVRKPKTSRSVNASWLDDRYANYNRNKLRTPVPRAGLVGWKISRARTPTTRSSSQAGLGRTPMN